jgi:endonuclease/exonuclease/phosphatase family metal-dependent hydrolase
MVLILILVVGGACSAAAQGGRIFISTLNCNAFFGGNETRLQMGQPSTTEDYWVKAQNLVGLWPTNPPLFIGLQEIGGAREVVNLSKIAADRYQHAFQPVFACTKDTYTEEACAGVVDLSQGWKISGHPGRTPLLDAMLSKHLVIELTNNFSALEICVVHLRRPMGKTAKLEQENQCKALKKWADSELAKNPKANVIILGDFNDAKPVGSEESPLAPLLASAGSLFDSFSRSDRTFHTHANGRAYDRILISRSLLLGSGGWKFQDVSVQRHSHGKGAEKYWFTDHFPVTAEFVLDRKK